MKPTVLVLAAGLLAGTVGHIAWFKLNKPCGGDELDCQLSWMRAELKLTDEQYARLRAIHEESSPRLLALAAQVAQMRKEYAAFERARVSDGHIDFLQFAHFVEQQRAIDRECLAATSEVVAAASGALTPAQRERYFGLLTPGPVGDERAVPQ